MNALGDPDDWARLSAAHSLGRFGADGKPAAAMLTALVEDKNRPGFAPLRPMSHMVPLEARKALREIGSEAEQNPEPNGGAQFLRSQLPW
jgi:hypothetical protein